MARTTLTKTDLPGAYAGDGETLTFEAADVTDMNDFVFTGGEIVIARNTDGGAAHDVTLSSADDPFGRREDIEDSVPADAVRVYGPFKRRGWLQSDGRFHLEADDAAIEFAVLAP
ncbi:MAG: hypothetical protein ACODAE_07920 [Gemmatimonadota bacterium]